MGKKPEAAMKDTLLGIEKASSTTEQPATGVEHVLDFKLSAAALDEIKRLEQCSIMAEHRLGEFRVG